MWWFIKQHNFSMGQSLSDGKDQSFSAKVWNSGTAFLNSLANCIITYVHTADYYSGFLGTFLLSDETQTNLSPKVTHELLS